MRNRQWLRRRCPAIVAYIGRMTSRSIRTTDGRKPLLWATRQPSLGSYRRPMARSETTPPIERRNAGQLDENTASQRTRSTVMRRAVAATALAAGLAVASVAPAFGEPGVAHLVGHITRQR
jgi:hypothetical protein